MQRNTGGKGLSEHRRPYSSSGEQKAPEPETSCKLCCCFLGSPGPELIRKEDMEKKEGKPSEDGITASPTSGDPGTPRGGVSAKEVTNSTAESAIKEGPPDGAEKQGKAAPEDGISVEYPEEANGLDTDKEESQTEASGKEETEAELVEEGGKKEVIVVSQEETDKKEETKPESKEVKEKEEATMASEKTDEKEATHESEETVDVNEEAKSKSSEAVEAEAIDKESKTESQKKADVKDDAEAQLREVDGKDAESDAKELVEPGSATEEQQPGREKESEEGTAVIPSSPEEWPESPTDEGHSLSPDGLGPDLTASGETSPSASESSPSDVPQSPTEPPPTEEKKKERAPERRVSAPARPRGPRAQNRKAIVDKFGGAASGPTALFRNTKAAGAAIGGVKNMLLEWCRAMTRNYEHVDIQNFSSSWSSGMAFCALIHKFFPDAFDYAELDPTKRRHNFTLAFSTAESCTAALCRRAS
ncbi:smoothelin-like protein 1 isoform X2 [Nannospalax galili]|uniref:smoothelin-like protein 1 isoform X2 n=1 Tax=Nannospalax galili TaxID=1026970 RepID=UPI00111BF009|nr:smoothelin-like protein 1 isoform X2 [Nannospalax galili]